MWRHPPLSRGMSQNDPERSLPREGGAVELTLHATAAVPLGTGYPADPVPSVNVRTASPQEAPSGRAVDRRVLPGGSG
jgi:hypothetical protein